MPGFTVPAANYFQFRGLLNPLWFVVSINDCSSKYLSVLFFNVNPTSFGEDFSSYVKNHPVLFILKQVSTCLVPYSGPRRDYKELIPHLLSPDHPWIWRLLLYTPSVTGFFPWPKALLSHSLSESCPYIQSSFLLFEIFPVLICATWEQGTRTTLTPPGLCKPCICTVEYRCPTF